MKKLLTILLLAAVGLAASAQKPSEEQFIEDLLSRMSIDDKIGQLNQIDGRIDLKELEKQIRAGRVSSIMNIVDPELVDHLQKIAVEQSPAGIPIIFSRDVVHGFKTMLPIPLGQAAAWNEELVERGARMAAMEASEAGIRWGFAPMIDVSRDSRWGRIAESFGEDALLNARLGAAQVRGYQTRDLSSPTAIAACAKHFVGYGAARGGRDYNGSDLTWRELLETYLVPFKAALDAGCASLMTSFQDNDGLQVSANKRLLKGVLRDDWGWDGTVVSDYGSIGQLTKHGIAENPKHSARIGLECGTDIDMMSKVYLRFGKTLLEEGAVSIGQIDDAVRNVLRLKYRTGLFERPYTQKETALTASREHLDIALDAALESAVLLKNNGVLPLRADRPLTVLLTGPMSDAAYDQLGTWDMDGDTTLTVTPKSAFLARNSKSLKVLYEPGLRYSRDKDRSGWTRVKSKARKADVIIVCLGEEQILSGEAHSLADIGLKGAQKEYVQFLSGLGKPLVASVMSGRANTLGDEAPLCDALLCQFHPGTMGGEALARIVFGEAVPSGHLPITFPKMVGQCPIYYNEYRHGRALQNARAVASLDDIPRGAKQSVLGHDCRYLDAGTKPLYPFGYGLSYADFEYGELSVESRTLQKTDTLRFSVNVKNTSEKWDARELVQVYVRDNAASLSRPVKELKAYRRQFVKAGTAETVSFEIPVADLGFYDIDYQYVVEEGTFTVEVGDCSDKDFGKNHIQFEIKVQ